MANREKRPRDDCYPWNVSWPSNNHRRLEILGDSKVFVNWMNGDWEVKGYEHNTHVRNIIYQFVKWYLSGTFRPRNDDESFWCRHIFCESNKAADAHANWLMDNGDSNPGAQWTRRDYMGNLKDAKHVFSRLMDRDEAMEMDTQSMRLFGLCTDHAMCSDHAEDVHRADANRLCQKKKDFTPKSWRKIRIQVIYKKGDRRCR